MPDAESITNPEVVSWWESNHEQGNVQFLTGHGIHQYINYFEASAEFEKSKNILEVGVGTGRATRDMVNAGKTVHCVDVSKAALSNLQDVAEVYEVSNMHLIPAKGMDLAFHVTVAQHVDDRMLKHHLTHILRSLKDSGVCFMQFAQCAVANQLHEEIKAQTHGGWSRSVEEVTSDIELLGGKCLSDHVIQSGEGWIWHAIKFRPDSQKSKN